MTAENGGAKVFISYSHKDAEVANSLKAALERHGFQVWLDKSALRVGDGIMGGIDRAIAESRFGVPILSRSYIASSWAKRELSAMFNQEASGQFKVLPILYNITQDELAKFSPLLSGQVTASIAEGEGPDLVTEKILQAMEVEGVGSPRTVPAEAPPPMEPGAEKNNSRYIFHPVILAIIALTLIAISLGLWRWLRYSPIKSHVQPCVVGEEFTLNEITYVHICGGTFYMGSNKGWPGGGDEISHKVTLGDFWVGKYEVTNRQYQNCCPTEAHNPSEDDLPVTRVTWERASEACKDFGGRLLTEAEWEYAARAGNPAAWSFGNDERELGEYAWYRGNAHGKPHKVGTMSPNNWGLYDMHGNVWEWVDDLYEIGVRDLFDIDKTSRHVLRGGSFGDEPKYLRSAFRFPADPRLALGNFGFRCGRDRKP